MTKKFRVHTTTIPFASLALLVGTTLLAILLGTQSAEAAPSRAEISVGIRVDFAPPLLPVYEQPPCPGPDYIWTPGYWAWGGEDYYWVPGTWIVAPDPGLFWTPGYWAWEDGGYVFTPGYWGPTVGFYGGIDYGFGYDGRGYVGGRWDRGHFYYNSAVNNVNVTVVHNTYIDRSVVVNNNSSRISFNGGNGGLSARPTTQEAAAARVHQFGPVAAQTREDQAARSSQMLHASYNHGAPPVAATSRPGNFSGSGVVPARNAATSNEEGTRTGNRGSAAANQLRQPAPAMNRQQAQQQAPLNRSTAGPQNRSEQRPETEQRNQQQTRPEQIQRPQQYPQARPAPETPPQQPSRSAPEQRSAPSQQQRMTPQHAQPQPQAQPDRAQPPQHTQPEQRGEPQQRGEGHGHDRNQGQ